jgi:hypothetical protein
MDADSIIDPSGADPRIWFRADGVAKMVKNRLQVEAEARRLADLGAT